MAQQSKTAGEAMPQPLAKRTRTSSFRLGSMCTGIGMCHRAALALSARNLSLDFTFVFASEVARAARKVLLTDFPHLQLFGDACECVEDLPPCDIFVAGFPCQPFSHANRKRKGSADTRCDVIGAILRYIERVCPRVVVFENVPGILVWGRCVLALLTDSLQKLGYVMDLECLKSHVHGGVPQKRKRLYVVALRAPSGPLVWPGAVPMRPLPSLLCDEVGEVGTVPRAPLAALKLKKVQRQLAQFNLSSHELLHMVVNCHGQLGQLSVEATPCLTSTRGGQGGFWLLGKHRMMTVAELCRLQGLDPDTTCLGVVVSKRQAGMLLGNSFTLPVIGRVLAACLRSIGCSVEDPF